jgi:hypothetical protein
MVYTVSQYQGQMVLQNRCIEIVTYTRINVLDLVNRSTTFKKKNEKLSIALTHLARKQGAVSLSAFH